jgi:LPS-assembly protein
MRKIYATLLCLAIALASLAQQPESGWTLEAPEEVEYDLKTGTAVMTNGIVRYGGSTLTARRAMINQQTGEAVAEGDVRIERAGQIWAGERVEYNFKTHRLAAENFKAGQSPFFVRGELVLGDQDAGVYLGSNGEVTTDDYSEPGFRLRSRRLIVVPGEYIEARHATLYFKNVPVFYYPYYRRSLRRHPNNLVVVPGYRSLYGPYLLTTYNWYWNDQLDGALHLDARQKRGFGFGPDVNFQSTNFGAGAFKYYYTRDEEPGLDFNQQPIDERRQRLWFTHRATVRSNLTAKVAVRYQSDAQIIRDFFESEYRKNVQPSSFLEVNQLWPNFSLDALGQVQVNQFSETVERLPDVKLTGFRQQIGKTPLYYETESSLGYFRRRIPTPGTNDFEAFRGDTYHQVTLPQTFFGWLNVLPRVGGRFTHYGEAEGNAAATREENRAVFNTGAELTFKASALWPGVSSRFWEMDGLRHIVEPSLNYVFVPHPTRSPSQLPQFDYELPTTRLLPIEFPDYNSIDSIDSQNVIRFGLRNRLQTKRKLGVDNLLNWALYADWRLRPRSGQSTFSDIYSDLDLKPFSWLVLSSETRYDLQEKLWREANHSAAFLPGDRWSFTVGHRFLREIPGFGPDSGNNLFFSTIYYRFSPNWGVRTSHYFEARDGVMEEQQYSLYRDLRSFTAALSFRVRESRTGPTDYTVAITASLKAFPRFDLGDDANKPSVLFDY